MSLNPQHETWYFIQRCLAALMLLALSPLLLVLAAVVKATSRGPVLYSQSRPGLGGQPIQVWKFRTMKPGSDRDPTKARAVTSRDPQVTAIGRILRNLKLDELPQLWNVVRGDMAIVGPRPIAFSLFEELCVAIPGFERRLHVRPGLTNVGQVCIEENAGQEHVIDDWKLRFEAEQHHLMLHSPQYDLVVIGMTAVYIAAKLGRALRGRRIKAQRLAGYSASICALQSAQSDTIKSRWARSKRFGAARVA